LFERFKKKAASAAKRLASYEPDPERILLRCDFNSDLCGWTIRGPGWRKEGDDSGKGIALSLDTDIKHSGASSLKITGRFESWQGATLNIADYIKESIKDYEAMVWVKIPDNAPSCKVCLSLETNSKLGGVVFPYYEQFADFDQKNSVLSKYRLPVNGDHGEYDAWETAYPKGHTTDDGWVLLHGKVKINRAEYFKAYVYIETNNQGANNDIYIDDFVLLRGS